MSYLALALEALKAMEETAMANDIVGKPNLTVVPPELIEKFTRTNLTHALALIHRLISLHAVIIVQDQHMCRVDIPAETAIVLEKIADSHVFSEQVNAFRKEIAGIVWSWRHSVPGQWPPTEGEAVFFHLKFLDTEFGLVEQDKHRTLTWKINDEAKEAMGPDAYETLKGQVKTHVKEIIDLHLAEQKRMLPADPPELRGPAGMLITDEEKQNFLTALGLLVEQGAKGATRTEVFKVLYPQFPTTTERGISRPQYGRLTHVIKTLVKEKSLGTTFGKFGIYGRMATRYHLLTPEAVMPETPKKEAPVEKPLRYEDVLKAVIEHTEETREPVSTNELTEKYFRGHPPEKVRMQLNYLVSTGELLAIKDGLTKKYHPPHVWANIKDKPDPDPEPGKPLLKKRVLGFECEVCGALVGVRAQAGMFEVACTSCTAEYAVDKESARRLGAYIEILVWTPQKKGIL